MPYLLYDFLDARGENVILQWLKSLQKEQLAKVNAKLKLLAQNGDGLFPSLLTPAVGSKHIREIVVSGKVAIRLLLCRGPFFLERECFEYTLLLGAFERDNRYVPKNAVAKAEENREIVLADSTRRIEHVHVGPGTS